MPDPPKDIRSDLLIVGEGAGDAALIQHLTEARGITGFQIEDAGGSSKFQSFISGLLARSGFNRLKALIVVADADEGADDSFNKIRTQMKAARIPCPHAAYVVARLPNITFVTYVLMIPFTILGDAIVSNTGALETILLPSAEAHLVRYLQCLNDWCDCAQMDQWTKTHRDTARLRSLLAAAYPKDPNIGLQWALSPSKNLIPLDHPSLDMLADLLRALPQQVLGQRV